MRIRRLVAATEPEHVAIGGEKLVHLKLSKGYRAGGRTDAFIGGFRIWDRAYQPTNRDGKRQSCRIRGANAHELGKTTGYMAALRITRYSRADKRLRGVLPVND